MKGSLHMTPETFFKNNENAHMRWKKLIRSSRVKLVVFNVAKGMSI